MEFFNKLTSAHVTNANVINLFIGSTSH